MKATQRVLHLALPWMVRCTQHGASNDNEPQNQYIFAKDTEIMAIHGQRGVYKSRDGKIVKNM